MFFFVGILALFVDKCHAVLNHLENGETGNLIKVENDYITDLHPFYVGSVHWEWCTKAEREQVDSPFIIIFALSSFYLSSDTNTNNRAIKCVLLLA